MEQKNYKLEIVNDLLKNEDHVRGLAKTLNINHMTILRKVNELLEENVIDYRQEGKNNVCFLKKTIESKTYAFMSENYRLLQVLMKNPLLRKIIDAIQKNNKIKMAILFGSYAKGLSKKDSDIDIYIETTDKKIKHEVELLDSSLSIKIGTYDKTNLLIKEIEKNHIIIKGVEFFYEKNKFFE